ncbi:hypothetical protein ABZ726_31320, partial [Streptomyces hundungensis]
PVPAEGASGAAPSPTATCSSGGAAEALGPAPPPVIVSAREKILDRDAFDSVHLSPVDDTYESRTREDQSPVPAAA